MKKLILILLNIGLLAFALAITVHHNAEVWLVLAIAAYFAFAAFAIWRSETNGKSLLSLYLKRINRQQQLKLKQLQQQRHNHPRS